jgi:hypothetical protein
MRSRSDIDATSSTCSLRNHCRNCSDWKSVSDRACAVSALNCCVTRFSCASAIATGSTMSAKSERGAGIDGIRGCSPESRRYCTSIIAWLRSSSACR